MVWYFDWSCQWCNHHPMVMSSNFGIGWLLICMAEGSLFHISVGIFYIRKRFYFQCSFVCLTSRYSETAMTATLGTGSGLQVWQVLWQLAYVSAHKSAERAIYQASHLLVIRVIYINAHYAQFFEYQIMAIADQDHDQDQDRRQTLNFYDIISWATRQQASRQGGKKGIGPRTNESLTIVVLLVQLQW